MHFIRKMHRIMETTERKPRFRKIVRTAGIVEFRRQGTQVYYRIADPAVFAICGVVCGAMQRSLDEKRVELKAGKAALAAGARA